MSRQDDLIVKTARRLVDKLGKSKYYKMNGEFPSNVKLEIERMKKHCCIEPPQADLSAPQPKTERVSDATPSAPLDDLTQLNNQEER